MSGTIQPGPGFELGGYRIQGWLGHGAMAEVYDSLDATGHVVALKVFRAGSGMSSTMLERFRREAEATKKLRRHPYILTVYETGREGEYHYIAMEKVEDSRTLESLIDKYLPITDVIKLVSKIAAALQYAHEHNVIHRDVKPSNIMLDSFKEPLLADFGVAELADWPSVTLSGALTGTPLYMPPEQARSDRVSPASDLYSLGVVMYELLTGRLPYELPEAPGTQVILEAVKNQEPVKPRTINKGISRDLEYLLLKLLRKNANDRYRSANELINDLERILDSKPLSARWLSPWAGTKNWFAQHRTAIFGATAFLMLAVAIYVDGRRELYRSRHQELILKAVNISVQIELAEMDKQGVIHPLLQSAEKLMAQQRWFEARGMLQPIVSLDTRLGDPQQIRRAMLSMARCETLLSNSYSAKETYLKLLSMGDVDDLTRQQALFEYTVLSLLDGVAASLEPLFEEHAAVLADPHYGPAIDVMLVGEVPENWRSLTATWSRTPRAYGRIAAEVARAPTQNRRQIIRGLANVSEEGAWPAPLADYLKGRLPEWTR